MSEEEDEEYSQSVALPIDEILQSDPSNEENKCIIEFFKQLKNERKSLSCSISSTNEKKNSLQNNDVKNHEMFQMLKEYTKEELNEQVETLPYYSAYWKEKVITYIKTVRMYIHMKYNKKCLDLEKYHTCTCSILQRIKRNDSLLNLFSNSPICIHLYLFGIHYKQIVYFIEVISSHLTKQKNNSLEPNSCLLFWLLYLLILLDSLQAFDSDVCSNLQKVRRLCIQEIKSGNISSFSKEELTSLLQHNCIFEKKNALSLVKCRTSILYIIYIMITELFNQK